MIKFSCMEGQFITNKDSILSDIINSILPKCNNAYSFIKHRLLDILSEFMNANILTIKSSE